MYKRENTSKELVIDIVKPKEKETETKGSYLNLEEQTYGNTFMTVVV